jgi:putative transposase
VSSIPPPVRRALADEAERAARELAGIEDPDERAEQAYLLHRRLFARWDAVLDHAKYGPMWLKDDRVAGLVAESLRHWDGERHDLLAYCIMSNHVHLALTPLPDIEGRYHSLTAIMQSIKGYTARKCNDILGRSGAFWEHESYDHWVRDADELQRILRYVVNNPVKARLADTWMDWRWTYCCSALALALPQDAIHY